MNELVKNNSLLLDRLELKENVEVELLKFINLQITKVNNESSLKKEVLQELSKRMADEEDPMNDVVLLKLLEILSKQDNDIALGIMDLMKANKTNGALNPENPNPTGEEAEPEKESDFTKKDVADIKGLLNTLEKVKKSEF